jgi:hypothetical protein
MSCANFAFFLPRRLTFLVELYDRARIEISFRGFV